MYQALYRQERPETFDEVLGQAHVVKILKNQVNKDTVGHAYLFCGTRGTGKTTMARLLAKGVNCTSEGAKPCGECANCKAIQNGNFIDVIEIDGASNNGVDSIRELRESVNYPPAIGRKKVYIIDEAHELTSHALNALLKTLEEPPENVIFILATTDPQQLLQTILSRCIRLDFHRIPEADLMGRMREICGRRGVSITDDALSLLTNNADGSARDALSLLDQCLAGSDEELDREKVLEYLGIASDDFFIKITDAVINGDAGTALILLEDILRDGKDVKQLMAGWMNHYRSLLIGKYISNPENMLNMSSENIGRLHSQAEKLSQAQVNQGISVLANTINDARFSAQPRTLLEMAILRLSGMNMTAGTMPQAEAPARKAVTPAAVKAEPAPAPAPKAEEPAAAPTPKAAETVPEAQKKAAGSSPAPEIKGGDFKPNPGEENATTLDPAPAGTDPHELDAIWETVWDRVPEIGSLTMVRVNSSLGGISEDEFKVLISTKSTINVAERNREDLEKAMEDIIGRPLKMVVKLVEKSQEVKQESLFEDLPENAPDGGDNQWSEIEGEAESFDEDEAIRRSLEAQLNLGNIEIIDEE